MSLALDPDQTFTYTLPIDSVKEGKQPTFTFRYLSSREYLAMQKLFNEAVPEVGEAELFATLYKAVRIPLVGWSNMTGRDGQPIPYNPDDLDLVTTVTDILNIRDELPGKLVLSELDRKNSARQLRSGPESSAAPADPDTTSGQRAA
jgi:hypothetical protein